jgi:hypothetical protein
LDNPSSGHCIYISKDVRMRGYFTNPEGAREQKSLGNTSIVDVSLHVMTFNGVTSVACRKWQVYFILTRRSVV